jgi:hypothetical protein
LEDFTLVRLLVLLGNGSSAKEAHAQAGDNQSDDDNRSQV